MKVMKKLLIGFLALSLVLLSFVSCNSNAITLEDGMGAVSFDEMQAAAMKSLNATVAYGKKSDFYWSYTAVKKDEGGKTGAVAEGAANSWPVVTSNPWTPTSQTTLENQRTGWQQGLSNDTPSQYQHTFSVGTWEFTLYAFDVNGKADPSDTNYIYKGTATAVVVASTTTKVTVGVSAVSSGTGTGTISFSNIIKPTGYGDVTLKYKLDNGTYSTTTSYSSQTLGAHTAYAAAFDGDTELVSSSIAVTVYRGLTTTVSGQVDDLTGAVEFDVTMPVTAAAEKQQAATTAGTLPAVTVVPQTSPDKVITKAENENTTVSIPAVSAPSGVTVNVGSNVATEVVVTAYSVQTAPQQFTIEQVGSGNTAVAGIDCTYAVSVDGGEAQTIKDFGNSTARVITYIEKGLTKVTITYVGTDTYAADKKHPDAGGASGTKNQAAINATDPGENAGLGYYKDTGKLVFDTYHFSTFCVATDAKVKIVETGYAYDSLEKAIAAATNGQTVQLMSNINANVTVGDTKSFSLDLNGKTLTGGTVSESAAIKNNGTLTIYDSASGGKIQREDTGSSAYYVIDNQGTLTIKSGTVTNGSGETQAHAGASLIRNGEVNNNAVLNVEGGTLSQNYFNVIKNSATVNIKGGTISCSSKFAVLTYGPLNITGGSITGPIDIVGYKDEDGDIHGVGSITGGTIDGAITVRQYTGCHSTTNPSLAISGETFGSNVSFKVGEGTSSSDVTADSSCGSIVITGGVYSNDPSAYVATGYKAVADSPSSGQWTVVLKTQDDGEVSVVKSGKQTLYMTLAEFRNSVNTGNSYAGYTITLLKNVDLSSVANWIPIGTSTNSFSGVFDGNNKTIKTGKQLFGVIKKSGTDSCGVKNLTVDVSYDGTEEEIGGLCIESYGVDFDHLTVKGSIACKKKSGAFVLDSYDATTFSYCVNEANLTIDGVGYNAKAAGFVATEKSGSVTFDHCENKGNILIEGASQSGTNGRQVFVGGFVAWCDKPTTINNSINSGNIEGKGFTGADNDKAISVAGFVAFTASSDGVVSITDCENTGDVTAIDNGGPKHAYAAGLIGNMNYDYPQSILSNNTVSGKITAKNDSKGGYAGGLIGDYNTTGTVVVKGATVTASYVVSGDDSGSNNLIAHPGTYTGFVREGTYNFDPSAYLAAGYKATKSATEPYTWTVEEVDLAKYFVKSVVKNDEGLTGTVTYQNINDSNDTYSEQVRYLVAKNVGSQTDDTTFDLYCGDTVVKSGATFSNSFNKNTELLGRNIVEFPACSIYDRGDTYINSSAIFMIGAKDGDGSPLTKYYPNGGGCVSYKGLQLQNRTVGTPQRIYYFENFVFDGYNQQNKWGHLITMTCYGINAGFRNVKFCNFTQEKRTSVLGIWANDDRDDNSYPTKSENVGVDVYMWGCKVVDYNSKPIVQFQSFASETISANPNCYSYISIYYDNDSRTGCGFIAENALCTQNGYNIHDEVHTDWFVNGSRAVVPGESK